MTISLYDASVAGFIQGIGALEGVMAKGKDYCTENDINLDDIVGASLCEDMLPFWFQVNSVVRHSIDAIDGVKAGEFFPDRGPDLNYEGLQAALATAKAQLTSLPKDEIEALASNDVAFKMTDLAIPFTGADFLMSFSVPNFRFHYSMAYAILRMKGVPIGKRDYLGQLRIKR